MMSNSHLENAIYIFVLRTDFSSDVSATKAIATMCLALFQESRACPGILTRSGFISLNSCDFKRASFTVAQCAALNTRQTPMLIHSIVLIKPRNRELTYIMMYR